MNFHVLPVLYLLFDTCINRNHTSFSLYLLLILPFWDVVLITETKGLGNEQLSDLQIHYEISPHSCKSDDLRLEILFN